MANCCFSFWLESSLRSKAYRNDQLWKTSIESHVVKHIYTYTHTYSTVHTYIHKWTSCMAFTMKYSRTRNRAPTLVVVLRNSLQFWIRNLVERNVRRTRNLRIMAGNHIPYFEALKKMQGLFKSTENHILAWLLHLQLHAPLFRFQKHLNLTWF